MKIRELHLLLDAFVIYHISIRSSSFDKSILLSFLKQNLTIANTASLASARSKIINASPSADIVII